MSNNIVIQIPILWEYVRSVRQQVGASLTEYPEELRSAAMMVASELVENAVKYGETVLGLGWARFSFEMTQEQIHIQVSNGLTNPTLLEEVQRTVLQMKPVGACERIYTERIHALVNDPVQPNRLGLWRIGYEGKFELDCTYAYQVLTINARRRLP